MQRAMRYLAAADPVLKRLIRIQGSCTLASRQDHFAVLADAIISQQISVKAAVTIFGRLKIALRGSVVPQRLLVLTSNELRACGVSRQKISSLRDLAKKWTDGTVKPSQFNLLNDEEIIEILTQVRGIGRWTAEMFLIFSLCRIDVLPIDDLGLRRAVKWAYGCRNLPAARTIRRIAEPWRPYRSIAVWYLWRSLEGGINEGKTKS